MSFIAKGAALLAFVLPTHAQPQHHIRPACQRTFTVAMAERGARATYAGTRNVTTRQLRWLGVFVHCLRNPSRRPVVHAYYKAQHDAWYARRHPRPPAAPGWAIPWSIVQCESGGRNLPPNSAGASGYYQIIPSTWASWGGQRYAPQAYEAPKADQDIIARAIWNGAGSSQWVCAGIVGY